MAATIVPITTLSPTSAPAANAAVRGVVTLIWPYSSSTKQCAVLIADPDFRLRNKKGQVRVRFSGPSAEAVALGKLGIGDEVLLELKGATWEESGSDAARTPGKSVDGELAFAGEVGLQKPNGEWIRANESRAPPVQETMQTPIAQNGGRVGLLRSSLGGYGDVPIYSSPAFVRMTRLSGDGFGDGYDPFTGEYDDLDAEAPRKRVRISFGNVGKWKLAGRSPSPEKEDRDVPQDSDADVDMEEDTGTVEQQSRAVVEDSAPRVVDFAHASNMAPPALPRLQMPEEPINTASGTQQGEDGPSTPNLRPVPSSALPLPSPFPAEPPRADPIVEHQVPAAATSRSTAASISQADLGLSQSLPDTTGPEDEDFSDSSPVGIYAHNSAIEGTYREHVGNPEYLSDTEEDENLYDEHIRAMREEAMRDDYNYNDHEQEVNEDDAEEVIEDMGIEPEENSDEEEEEEDEADSESNGPTVIEIDEDAPEEHDTAKVAEDRPKDMSIPAPSENTPKEENDAAHYPAADEAASTHVPGPVDATVPAEDLQNVLQNTFNVSRKRKPSPQAIPAPQTPAKVPAGIFGMDGTTDTAQSTPQSERDRIMARTYSSLFGFSGSPAPPQPAAQTPTPSAGISNMGRVTTETAGKGAALQSALKDQPKLADADIPRESQDRTESVPLPNVVDEADLPPRTDAAEVATPAIEAQPPAAQQEPRQVPTAAQELHQSPVVSESDSGSENQAVEQGRRILQSEDVAPLEDVVMADATSAPHPSSEDGDDAAEPAADEAYAAESDPVELDVGEQSVHAKEAPAADVTTVEHDAMESDAFQPDAIEQAADVQEAPATDVAFVEHDAVEPDAVEQLVHVEEAPAAILEAAIESDEDMNTTHEAAIQDSSNVGGLAADAVASAPVPSQVEVIDLDSSDGDEEQEEAAEETNQLDQDGASQDVQDLEVPHFPGSPTEVDDEENEAALEAFYSQPGKLQEEAPEDTSQKDESAQDSRERTIPETLQTQDAENIQPEEDVREASFFDDQMPVVEDAQMQAVKEPPIPDIQEPQPPNVEESQSQVTEQPPVPSTQHRKAMSFNYFSFQSSTSAAGDSFSEERLPTPEADVAEEKTKTEVIELVSSSPRPGDGERQTIDSIAQPVVAEEHDAQDERMSDAEAFSPEVPATKHVSFAVEDGADVEDEPMSDAEAFSPEPVVAQSASLDAQADQDPSPDARSLEDVASEATGNQQSRHEHLPGAVEHSLPLSPEDSQSQTIWESQLPPPAPQGNTATFPPTPQLTQGDSLIKEAEVVVVEEEFKPATPDPPSRHTRSSVDPAIVAFDQTRHVTPDPPSRHTRSSVEPTSAAADPPSRHARLNVETNAAVSRVTPDPPARHTRSSVEPTTDSVPDPPSRDTRSSAEPSTVDAPDPPSRHTRSSAEPTAEKGLQSPFQRTPARRSKRQSQTHSQISVEPIEENKLEEEAQDTIAVLSPLPRTPVRKSTRAHKPATREIEMKETEELLGRKSPAKKQPHDTEEHLQKKSPAKRSFTSRLSNVPDVISAWFSPRRSTRLHADEEEAEEKPKQPAATGLSTSMGYYTPLSNLSQSMNSQARDNTVDVIAIVTDSTKAPERAKAGPKDYFTCFKMWDASLDPGASVFVEVFRPWKATLPTAEVGDVILLRGFAVKSRKRQPYLISSETSGWCVWRYAEYESAEDRKGKKRAFSFSGIREEVKGPPVEFGTEEKDRVQQLREVWEKSK